MFCCATIEAYRASSTILDFQRDLQTGSHPKYRNEKGKRKKIRVKMDGFEKIHRLSISSSTETVSKLVRVKFQVYHAKVGDIV